MNDCRVAWLLPVAWFYWQPALSELARAFPQTKVFTGRCPGFAKGYEGTLEIEIVGERKVFRRAAQEGYGSGFTYLSPSIVGKLFQFKPHVIFSSSFGVWTLLALLFKPLGRWRVVLAYEGSAPGVDFRGSAWRLALRRLMVRASDALITNSQAGKAYLVEVLGAPVSQTAVIPYEVPSLKSLPDDLQPLEQLEGDRPIFLFVGRIMPRKGLRRLLEACALLQQQGYQGYTLWVVGDGDQQPELQAYAETAGLSSCVRWLGRVDYDQISSYFRAADVFVLPTLEDTWGVVVLEAMLLGKPVLCSKGAGTAELITDGKNGYVFAPDQPAKLADLMRHFIDRPETIAVMGEAARQEMARHTPEAAAEALAQVVQRLCAPPASEYVPESNSSERVS